MHGGRMLFALTLVLAIFQGLLVVKATPSGSYALIPSCSMSTKTILYGCTFESNNCGFTKQMTMGWRRRRDKFHGGFLGLFQTGDHTTGSGYFLAPETDKPEIPRNAIAELVLPLITTHSLCLDFWYTSQGNSANIKVLLECESGTRQTLFSMGAIDTGDWREIAISIEYPEAYKIIFQTTKTTTAKTLCLDDIRVYKTRPSRTPSHHNLVCSPGSTIEVTGKSHASSIPTASSNIIASGELNIDCSFENGSCGWRQGSEDDFDWQIGSASKAHGISVPKSDHTTGDGHYAFIDGREVRNLNWTAQLTSDPIISNSDLVFTFWYHMNGIGIGSLKLYKNNLGGEEETLWYKIGRQGPGWTKATVQIGQGRFKLAFVATVKYHYDSDLAIDDTSLANATISTTTISTTTTTTTPVQLPVLCDFEENSCAIEIIPNVYDTVTWEQRKGPLIYHHTVYIDGDNSTGSGTYMSLKLLNGRPQNGDTAVLRLPPVQSNIRTCLTLAYILPSSNSGTIAVYRKLLSIEHGGKLVLVKELSGNKGKGWKRLSVDLEKSGVFQILIEGSYTGEPASFIGIDDLALVPGLCPDLITTTPPPTTTTAPPIYLQEVNSCRTENTSQIPAISCTFDTSLCGYQIRDGQLGGWARKTGQYDGISRGTKESYLVVSTKTMMMAKNAFAQVESNLIDNRNFCVEFSYIMPEIHSNLELWLHFSSGQKVLIWNENGNHSDSWKEAALTLNVEYEGRFQIVFQSTKTGSFGLVGVDNIVGYNLKDDLYTASYSSSSYSSSHSLPSTQTVTNDAAQTHPSHTLIKVSSKTNSSFLTSRPIKVPSRSPHTASYTSSSPTLSSRKSSEKAATTTNTLLDSTSNFKATSSSSRVISSTVVTPTSTVILSKSTTHILLPVSKPTTIGTDNPVESSVTHKGENVSHYDSSKGDHYKGTIIGVTVSVFAACVLIMVVFIIKKRAIILRYYKIRPNNFQMKCRPNSSKDVQTKNETNAPEERSVYRTEAL